MKSICVFCGSSSGNDPAFLETARELGETLADRGITLVYGGANIGLMGAVADAALHKGGTVVGVLPDFLRTKEVAHEGLTELILCDSMHERKGKMFELSEGFIVLPGGFGTLEEVAEILTWQQLGLHQFPVAILNVNGYYDALAALFQQMETKALLKPENREMAIFATSVHEALELMANYQAPSVTKWIDSEVAT